MSVTRSSFIVHSYFQQFVSLPYTFDAKISRVTENSRYYYDKHGYFRMFNQTLATLMFSVIIYHLYWLLRHWKTFALLHLEQVAMYTIILCLVFIQYAGVYVLVANPQLIMYALNQCIQLNCGSCKSRTVEFLVHLFVHALLLLSFFLSRSSAFLFWQRQFYLT